MLTFEQFRAKLADVVTVAINKGRRVQPADNGDTETFCPLGCHPEVKNRRPMASDAASAFGISGVCAFSFLRGFEGCERAALYNDGHEEAFALGRLYRRRFGGKP